MPELSQADIEVLRGIVRVVRGTRGSGGNSVTVSSNGITISGSQARRPPVVPDGWDWIRITSAGSGNGMYNARIQRGKTGGTFTVGADLNPSNWLEDISTSDDCILAVSTDSSHSLKTDGTQYVLAYRDRISADSPPKMMYATSGGGGALPSGTGQYKVLMLIDNLNPGTWGIDYPRFHT